MDPVVPVVPDDPWAVVVLDVPPHAAAASVSTMIRGMSLDSFMSSFLVLGSGSSSDLVLKDATRGT
jgi:hypothetical protein